MFKGIPTSFWLYGQNIAVNFDPTLSDVTDCVGESHYRRNEIVLQPNTEGVERLVSRVEQTFLHELVHYIFYMLGEDDLRKNEKLIDGVASLLHQAINTAEYEEDI